MAGWGLAAVLWHLLMLSQHVLGSDALGTPFSSGALPRGPKPGLPVRHRSLRQVHQKTTHSAYLEYLSQHESSRKELRSATNASRKAQSMITLQGNAVLVGNIRVYLIYYGNWKTASPVIENFVTSLSQSSTTPKGPGVNRASDWWKILEGYTNRQGAHVGKVVFGGRYFDKYSLGKDLTKKVGTVVYNALLKKKLPVDSNAVYMVLTSADVLETPTDGFCAGTYPFKGTPIGYCGWHWYLQTPGGKTIPYAFVGNPNQCVQRCGHLEGRKTTPNGDVGVDGMVNVLAHELAEAVTDFDGFSGWYSLDSGDENGDLCNRKWGKVSTPASGQYVYNMVGQGGMRWLVQLMWDRHSSSCRMQPSS